MNRIDLTNIGGFPLEQDTLKFMQDGTADMIASLANLLGDKVILSGVQVVGGNVTSGWITYQGEIIKFIGGVAGPDVVISETTQDALFEDGVLRPVYKTRTASIGGPATFPFSDLKPANIGVPVGTVLMWSGNVAAIPAGFALCDGTNGTPNLSGRFIVGYDPGDVDYDTLGKIGGEKKHQLTVAEMPAHDHGLPVEGGGAQDLLSLVSNPNVDEKMDANTKTTQTGGNLPHENRPPYYTLAYIIKL